MTGLSETRVRTTDVSPLVKNNTHRMNQLSGRHSYWDGVRGDGGSKTHVQTTDISPSVNNNTDRMNQLVR